MAIQFGQRGATLVLWDLDGATLATTEAELRSQVPGIDLHT